MPRGGSAVSPQVEVRFPHHTDPGNARSRRGCPMSALRHRANDGPRPSTDMASSISLAGQAKFRWREWVQTLRYRRDDGPTFAAE